MAVKGLKAMRTTSKNNVKQPQITTQPNAIKTQIPENTIITQDNILSLGERISVRALKTCIAKSGQPFMYDLYNNLIADITHNIIANEPLTDAYDIVQTACLHLCKYIGKGVIDNTTDGQTDKDGKPITILRATFRAVNKYIMGERAHEYKRVYVDDVDASGNILYYTIPDGWDMPTATDYKKVCGLIEKMGLSANEKKVLYYRLRGIATCTIAEYMGVKKQNIITYQQRILKKAEKISLTLKNYKNILK